ncbi:30S ribosomal protein S6 [Rhodospirillum rubrum]|uniref:30S ribosomal protein S6 n=1 Tax=Rhodospirillum rubrum TaxID=1085 RepID=UPI001904A0A0|nr:30S ribosomal protein S6 [Rhodospirillum rubrum]MBK1663754.1 30S ribosomal protein S6 [Rhodospirillum rubrum]MBK1676673.1 30S ribosomal protein S6 [Rhodospirillum rubrum]
MALYECVLIARQDISNAQVDTMGDEVSAILSEGGGSVSKREYWGLRTLNFRIKKNRKGHYLLLNIDAPAPAVHELDRRLRLNEDVIRHMTVKVEELEEAPSAMMQKNDRPERGGRRGDRFGDRPERGDRPDRGDRGGDRGADRGDRAPRGERRPLREGAE